jgi:ammonium transporter Rh
MFGAYFGLAVAGVIGKPPPSATTEGGHIADIFSLIGTVFLWIYWPSFNGGALPAESHQQQRAVIGTIFCMTGSTIASFIVSSFLSATGRFRPVDIQNATLAGGVAIGAVCHLTLSISDCILIGFAAGSASTYGFSRLQPKLDDLGIHDSCGVNNLHGIPSLIGGLASLILTAYKGPRGHDMPIVFTHRNQWSHQFSAIALTLALSISSGLFTGALLKLLANDSSTPLFIDEPYWEMLDEEGLSFHDRIKKDLIDLEAGIEATKAAQDIVNKCSSLMPQAGFSDFSVQSRHQWHSRRAHGLHKEIVNEEES